MANRINNKYEYRSRLLDSLQVQHTASDVRNEDEYRKKVLNGLGVEYTDDDINQKSLYHAKVVEGFASSGGGGSSDFSTAEVTVQISNATHLFLPAKNEGEPITSVPFAPVSDMEEMTIEVILYKGSAMALWTGIDTLTVSGNIQAIKNGLYMITGDCTIKTQS